MDREIRFGGAILYQGAEEKAYCAAFAEFLGGGYADAVNSGTNAVYVALRALDLEPGSEIIVPPLTDPGGTMPVAVLNCIPVPADSGRGMPARIKMMDDPKHDVKSTCAVSRVLNGRWRSGRHFVQPRKEFLWLHSLLQLGVPSLCLGRVHHRPTGGANTS